MILKNRTQKSILVRKNSSSVFSVVRSPSFLVSIGDEVRVSDFSKLQVRVSSALVLAKEYGFVKWVSIDPVEKKGTYLRHPNRNELSARINEQLVVEWYSRY